MIETVQVLANKSSHHNAALCVGLVGYAGVPQAWMPTGWRYVTIGETTLYLAPGEYRVVKL